MVATLAGRSTIRVQFSGTLQLLNLRNVSLLKTKLKMPPMEKNDVARRENLFCRSNLGISSPWKCFLIPTLHFSPYSSTSDSPPHPSSTSYPTSIPSISTGSNPFLLQALLPDAIVSCRADRNAKGNFLVQSFPNNREYIFPPNLD